MIGNIPANVPQNYKLIFLSMSMSPFKRNILERDFKQYTIINKFYLSQKSLVGFSFKSYTFSWNFRITIEICAVKCVLCVINIYCLIMFKVRGYRGLPLSKITRPHERLTKKRITCCCNATKQLPTKFRPHESEKKLTIHKQWLPVRMILK